jgi:hypothetical protein
VPRFRVRYRNTYYELPQGEFVVGRAPGCQLMLDDPRVSRRHTLFHVEAQRLTVEDLHSRNGTLVNGVLLKAPLVLADRDLVTIGSQEIRVVAMRDTDERTVGNALAPTAPDLSLMLPVEDPTEVGGLSPLLTLFDKALLMGSYDEGERYLKQIFSDLSAGGGMTLRMRNPAMLDRIARSVIVFSSATGRGAAVDQVFALFQRAGLVMQAPLLDEFHTLVRKLKHPLSPQLRDYVEWLRSEADRLGPAERFALQRAEGLIRALRGQAG